MNRTLNDVGTWLLNAIFASVSVDPESPGLSRDELHELARRHGVERGELQDALWARESAKTRDGRYLPEKWEAQVTLLNFHDYHESDPRDLDAFVFVYDYFKQEEKRAGKGRATIARQVFVERAAAQPAVHSPVRQPALTSQCIRARPARTKRVA